jgi:hypothetical protein
MRWNWNWAIGALVTMLVFGWCSQARAQTSRMYGQVYFKNGGAYIMRDSAGVVVQIGSANDVRRTVVLRTDPVALLGIVAAFGGTLPKQTLPIGPYAGVTWRADTSGVWATIVTPGLGGYFRPTPNVPPHAIPFVRAALIFALQGLDVEPVIVDLKSAP